MDIVLAIVGSSAFTGVVLKLLEYSLDRWGKAAREKRDAQAAAFEKLEKAVECLAEDNLVILHDRIYAMFTALKDRETLTADEKANLDYLYERYRAHGGNHRAVVYYRVLDAKPVVAGGDDDE